MRATVAVVGPGGVGGFVAGVLARAGNDVTVVAREATAQVIAQDGIQVDSVRGLFPTAVVIQDLAELRGALFEITRKALTAAAA